MGSIIIKVWHRVLKQVFWFDVLWGNRWHSGSGYIGMLSEGTERVYHPENRIDVDPEDCDLISIVCENTGQEIIAEAEETELEKEIDRLKFYYDKP